MSATEKRMEQLGYLGISGDAPAPAMGPLILIPEQFEVPEPLLDIRAVAAGPSPERAAELRAELAQKQDDLARSRGKTMGQLSALRSRIREINRELAGNAAAKDVAAWLKARAKGTKGAFDPELMGAVFAAWLPGWSIQETTGLVRLTGAMSGLDNAGLERPYQEENPWEYYPRPDPKHKDWRHRLAQPISDTPVAVQPIVEKKKIQIEVADPIPGVLYAVRVMAREDADNRSVIILHPPVAVGVQAWEVKAPSGETTTILDAPGRDKDSPVTSDGFWKWAAGQGLTKAAEAVAPLAEASIPRASSAAGTKAMRRNYCQACFRDVAIYPGSGLVVAHNYRRPGFGHIIQNCEGSDWPPYDVNCELVKWAGQRQARGNAQNVQEIQRLRRNEGTITVWVETRDEKGRRIPETDEKFTRLGRRWKQHSVLLHPGHVQWPEVRDQVIQQALGALRQGWSALVFYRAAVRVWHPGVDIAEIQVTDADRVGKPAELGG